MDPHLARNQSRYLEKNWPFMTALNSVQPLSFPFLDAPSLKDSTTSFQTLNIKVNTVRQMVGSKLITFTGL